MVYHYYIGLRLQCGDNVQYCEGCVGCSVLWVVFNSVGAIISLLEGV